MKSKLIKNTQNNAETKSRETRLLSNCEINCLSQFSDIKDIKNNNLNEIPNSHGTGWLNSNISTKKDNGNTGSFESLFLKNLVENLFEYLSEQNNKEERLFNKIDQVPILLEKENNIGKDNNNL